MRDTHIENFSVGAKMTILSWAERIKEQEVMTPMGPMQVVQKFKSDSLVGDVIEILAVQVPCFLSMRILSGPHYGKKGTLDTRECRLIKVSEDYFNSLQPDKEDDCKDENSIEEGPEGIAERLFKQISTDPLEKRKERPADI